MKIPQRESELILGLLYLNHLHVTRRSENSQIIIEIPFWAETRTSAWNRICKIKYMISDPGKSPKNNTSPIKYLSSAVHPCFFIIWTIKSEESKKVK